MGSDKLLTVTDANFDAEVLKSSEPVVIDFWAPWCGPCRQIAPVVEHLADKYAGKIKVGKLDIDQHPKMATQYDVRSIPMLLLFKDGKVQGTIIGAQHPSKIEELFKKAL